MRRQVKVRLTQVVGRGKRKRTVGRTVVVYQVTLGGFIEALRVAGEQLMRFRVIVRKGGKLSLRDVKLALLHPAVCIAVADVLCPREPRGWYEPWHSEKNVARMLLGAQQTSDWGRLIGQLSLSGGKKNPKRQGDLTTDAIALARLMEVNPMEVIHGWPMERFLDLADGMIREREAAAAAEYSDDPTMDPEAKPTPLIPGLGKQWTA